MNNEQKPNKLSNFIAKIKTNKTMQYGLIIILAVISLLVLFGGFDTKNKNLQSNSSTENYVTSLEERLSNSLSKVDGAGKVSVVITVESGMETVLASEKITNQTSTGKEIIEKPILVNGKTVVLKELYPKISGVLIVAEGARNVAVFNKIQQATISLFDINVNQIEILTMK